MNDITMTLADHPTLSRRPTTWLSRLASIVLFTSSLLLAGEATARVQDWIAADVPLLSNPDYESSLFVNAAFGRQGRPHGRFGKWRLNGFGFRSPEMLEVPAPGTTRIAILGASETFGLYETAGQEFPSQLATRLSGSGRFEIVNVALPGMTLNSADTYYRNWVSRFRPDQVVIYPSPLFYLHDSAPGTRRAGQERDSNQILAHETWSSRLVQRLRDLIDVPDTIQRWRDARTIAAAEHGKPTGWVFSEAPRDRVELFMKDLRALVSTVRASGAMPILLTHATRVRQPPSAEDDEYLWRARVNVPRAKPRVIADFEAATNEEIRRWAVMEGIQLIDAAHDLGGRPHLFVDLAHFNDAGAAEMASLLLTALEPRVTASNWSR